MPINNDPKAKKLFCEGLVKLDEIVRELAGGQYVLPSQPGKPVFAIRELLKYAEEKGIDTSELTDEELEIFVTNWDTIAEPYKKRTIKISERLP